MIIEISEWRDIDGRKLMDLYQEGNLENIDYFYPGTSDRDGALQKIEHDFLEYIRNDFLDGRNRYMVSEHDGLWISALRLYYVKDRFYYIEALETHPDHRKRGYASQLLSGVLELLKKQGPFTVCDCVHKKNAASVATHLKCGFKISENGGYDYLQNEPDDQSYGMEFVYLEEAPL
ncbi:MAG: GNAT family N-acetyltransferase [bacterium]|nr:GNAT family N-acetyltransferase [bacterium]